MSVCLQNISCTTGQILLELSQKVIDLSFEVILIQDGHRRQLTLTNTKIGITQQILQMLS